MPAKLIPASDWNAARFSPPLSPQILRRWCRDFQCTVHTMQEQVKNCFQC